jgi:hypothetical protein
MNNQAIAGGLVGLSLVCASVLVALGKLPIEVVTHALVAVTSIGATYLVPKSGTPAP